jgi:hypothetical protein
VSTTTTTTIGGVSLMTRHGAGAPDVFEIVLSGGGIDFHRPKRPSATLTWDRVSGWEIEEREDDIVLTLQGGGADTALLIPDWSAADLGALLRQLSERPSAGAAGDQVDAAVTPSSAAPRGERDENRDPVRGRHRRSGGLAPWKAVVTIVLLGVLAAAVTIVLLQSAGVINWNILGPTS